MSLILDAFGSGGFATIDIIMSVFGIGFFLAVAFYLYVNKFSYKYLFIEFDRKGNFALRKAKMSKNKRGIKKFILKSYQSPEHYLTVKQHNGLYNGKVARYIVWDGAGFLTYATPMQIKKKFLSTSLVEVDRTQAIDDQMEAYDLGNSMSRGMKALYTGLVIFCLFTIVASLTVAKYSHEMVLQSEASAFSIDTGIDNFNLTAEIYNDHTQSMKDLVYVLEKVKAK